MVRIRKGEVKDFEKLSWGWKNSKKILKKYIEAIKKREQEFFVVEDKNNLIGEIHIFWKDKDKQKADGKNRAYLSAFGIHKDFQGKGIGTKLIGHALNYIKKKGYTQVTIGSYKDENKTQRYYNKLCFKRKIKTDTDKSIKPQKDFILFLREL